MEQNSLFPFKYRLRNTDELVEVIAWETADKGARSENDWVSYIDAEGNEHIKEHLTLEWDFKIDSPLDKVLSGGWGQSLPKYDAWEGRRYELVSKQVIENGVPIEDAIALADVIIAKLNPDGESASEKLLYDPKKGL